MQPDHPRMEINSGAQQPCAPPCIHTTARNHPKPSPRTLSISVSCSLWPLILSKNEGVSSIFHWGRKRPHRGGIGRRARSDKRLQGSTPYQKWAV